MVRRQRSKKLSEGRKTNSDLVFKGKDHERTRNEDSDDESVNEGQQDGDGDAAMEKDDSEDELDRLVLGNEASFLEELKRETGLQEDDDEDEAGDVFEDAASELASEDAELNLENVDDAELFYLDAAPSALDKDALIERADSEDRVSQGDAPAWDDSDDDRLMVSLAGNTRLRKLRVYEGEDLVSGKEYIKRLRRQFERLHPAPEWATVSERPAKRRRRSSAMSDSSFTSEDDEDQMEVDEDDLSTLPLARLLQNSQLLTQTATTATKYKFKPRPEVLDIQRTRDISGPPQPSAITSLSFHPIYPILLSSGLSSTLYLHQIAPSAVPTPNPLITSIHIKHTPLHTSAFHPPTGDKIFFSGRRRYFHTWDLPSGTIQKSSHANLHSHKEEQRSFERFKLSPCGRWMGVVGTGKKGGGGVVNIIDAATTQWIAAARIEGGRNGVADFAWWADGAGLTIVGKGGEVGEWSLVDRAFRFVWHDVGGGGVTVVALGGYINIDGAGSDDDDHELGPDRYLAIGSTSGIVSIYDRATFVPTTASTTSSSTSSATTQPRQQPQPLKTLTNLTTPTSLLSFNPPPPSSSPSRGSSGGGQILVIASRWKKDALRLVHLQSGGTVYRNWPTGNTPLGRVSAVAWGWVGGSAGDENGGDGAEKKQLMLAVGNEAGRVRLWEVRG